MRRLILMIQFMTRIPLPVRVDFRDEDLGKGNIYFPLIGILIGLLMAAGGWAAGRLFGPGMLTAIFTVAVYIWASGGLHLDGITDTFDGLWSNRPPERILEIMKDSRIGTFGALGLMLTLLIQVGTIGEVGGHWQWLILAPMLGRYGCVFGNAISRYARPDGMGKRFVEDCGMGEWMLASVYTWPVALWLGRLPGVVAAGCVLGFTYLFTRWVQKKIGGITGDIIGAVIELNQLLVLLLAAAWLC